MRNTIINLLLIALASTHGTIGILHAAAATEANTTTEAINTHPDNHRHDEKTKTEDKNDEIIKNEIKKKIMEHHKEKSERRGTNKDMHRLKNERKQHFKHIKHSNNNNKPKKQRNKNNDNNSEDQQQNLQMKFHQRQTEKRIRLREIHSEISEALNHHREGRILLTDQELESHERRMKALERKRKMLEDETMEKYIEKTERYEERMREKRERKEQRRHDERVNRRRQEEL
mmetsp:Transcript_854/g.1840  ORF Transcript_854/g.1840 Transcript_854/m.1840 type:complete len:230 (+) Transcript_854:62-751(+)